MSRFDPPIAARKKIKKEAATVGQGPQAAAAAGSGVLGVAGSSPREGRSIVRGTGHPDTTSGFNDRGVFPMAVPGDIHISRLVGGDRSSTIHAEVRCITLRCGSNVRFFRSSLV